MAEIYVVTVLWGAPADPQHLSRSWGYFYDLLDARQAVLENHTDMFEDGYYRYAVVEKVPQGLMPEIKDSWWFEAVYTSRKPDKGRVIRDPEVKEIPKPSMYDHVVGFSLG